MFFNFILETRSEFTAKSRVNRQQQKWEYL